MRFARAYNIAMRSKRRKDEKAARSKMLATCGFALPRGNKAHLDSLDKLSRDLGTLGLLTPIESLREAIIDALRSEILLTKTLLQLKNLSPIAPAPET